MEVSEMEFSPCLGKMKETSVETCRRSKFDHCQFISECLMRMKALDKLIEKLGGPKSKWR